MDGVLVVCKPVGCTSHDVVAHLRRLFGIKKVGHAGTLDPIASGVLVALLGSATRLAEYATGHDKTYLAGVTLGVETDSCDTTGTETSRTSATHITRAAVESVLERFRGDILQMPPMYSAVKVYGKRLYKLARQGVEAPREARPLTVHNLELVDFTSGEACQLLLRMTVSSGFYVRSLAADVGAALGVGGCMHSLVRERSGPFTLHQAVTLENLEATEPASRWDSLLPSWHAAIALPLVELDADGSRRFMNGMSVAADQPEGLMRVTGCVQGFLGIGQVDDSGCLHPVKVLCHP